MLKIIIVGLVMLLTGCASYGVIENAPLAESTPVQPYSVKSRAGRVGSREISFVLALSGGGTRAAALAYGVMKSLRDTTVVIDGQPRRLLDEVDMISSVSGGSFTSAYYGLNGEGIFEDFEEQFLRRDIEKRLIQGFFNPARWFSSTGRTEMAVRYYDTALFHGATFDDLARKDGPLILINASDLGYGVRFSFVQEYFNLLCSDISTYPVARAVAASSAVPVLFHPIVVENYHDCKKAKPEWLAEAEARLSDNPDLSQVLEGVQSYYNEDRRKYAHFVDGGITDNLGLRAVYEITEISGGPKAFFHKINREPPRHLVFLSVNASTDPEPEMDMSDKQPSLSETMQAVSAVQIHRYNATTLELMRQNVERWAQTLSTAERPVTSYFIQIGINDIEDPASRQFFNAIPTSFSLTDEQVDRLIAAGDELLHNNTDFQRLMVDIGGVPVQSFAVPTSEPVPHTAAATK